MSDYKTNSDSNANANSDANANVNSDMNSDVNTNSKETRSKISNILEESINLNLDRLKYKNIPWKTILVYFIFGVLWILFSDTVLDLLVNDHEFYILIQSYKGIFYVILTTVLLYFLIRYDYHKIFKLSSELYDKNDTLLNYSKELYATQKQLKDKIQHLNIALDNLSAHKDFIHTMINNSNTAIMIWHLDGSIYEVNEHFLKVTGYKESEVLGKKWHQLILTEEDSDIYYHVRDSLEKQTSTKNFENRLKTKTGKMLDMLWNDSLIMNPVTKEQMAASFGIDITDKKKSEQRIQELAYKDQLTGLNNRFIFERDVRQRIASDTPFTLYYLDIDNFRSINEIYGHQYGDKFIRSLSKSLSQNDSNCKLYRWCGDEMMILDDSDHYQDIELRTSWLFNTATEKWLCDHIEYHPSISIGIAQFPKDGTTLDDIFKNIDIALHHAKVSGKSKASLFSTEFQKEFERMVEIENVIYEALKTDGFELYFQPIYQTITKQIHCMETLLRLTSNKQLFSTGEVIEVAENTGQILKIDRWVIENTFKFIQNHLKDTQIVVSINLSTRTIENDDTIYFLKQLIETYQIEPSKIEFEITEHTLLLNTDQSFLFVDAIKELGFRLSLDDFGTRYSSLNYLSKIPFDTLKIDKSYIDQMTTNIKSNAIVSQLIQLSHQIGLTVVAEGVEDEDQYLALKLAQCDLIQGYYFSKPIPEIKILDVIF